MYRFIALGIFPQNPFTLLYKQLRKISRAKQLIEFIQQNFIKILILLLQ